MKQSRSAPLGAAAPLPRGGHDAAATRVYRLLQVVADYTRLNAMKRGLRGGNLPGATVELTTRRPMAMLHAGLDLSRHRLDVRLLDAQGSTVQVTAAPPDADGLRGLPGRPPLTGSRYGRRPGSMNGARFVHDQLELAGWQVAIADAQKVKGLAPLACKTDRIDAWVLAELSRRDLVPE